MAESTRKPIDNEENHNLSIPDQYLEWFYNRKIWKFMSYRGIRTLKFPMDMWNYQEIIFEKKIDWVIEAGTRHGGSAVYFADLLAMANARGRVITIDVQPELQVDINGHQKITSITADSGSEEVVRQIYEQLPDDRGPLLLILDSDHTKNHVSRELHAHVKYLQSGDYLIVEDTAINGHPVHPDFGPGPMEAVEEFLMTTEAKRLSYDKERAEKFGTSFANKAYFLIK